MVLFYMGKSHMGSNNLSIYVPECNMLTNKTCHPVTFKSVGNFQFLMTSPANFYTFVSHNRHYFISLSGFPICLALTRLTAPQLLIQFLQRIAGWGCVVTLVMPGNSLICCMNATLFNDESLQIHMSLALNKQFWKKVIDCWISLPGCQKSLADSVWRLGDESQDIVISKWSLKLAGEHTRVMWCGGGGRKSNSAATQI